MTTRTPCSGVAPSGTHKKTDLAYTRPATYPAQRPCLRASLKGGVLSPIRPLHPDSISFALLCALAGIVSASRIATARLAFVIVYSVSATPQFHNICVGGERAYLRFFHKICAAVAATSQPAFAPRPGPISPDGPRYFRRLFFPSMCSHRLEPPLRLAIGSSRLVATAAEDRLSFRRNPHAVFC